MRTKIAFAFGLILFFILAGTTASNAYWSTAVDQKATVAVASLSANCTPATRLQNGSFETPALTPGTYAQLAPALVTPWSTTDTSIEIWSSGFNGVPSAVGNQFAELNSTRNGTLYQDVATTPGQTVRWSLLHRARVGTDTMSVSIGVGGTTGAVQGTYSATTAAWVRHEGIYTIPAGQTLTRFAFSSVSTGSGSASVGNFIDDVSFGSGPCLVASTKVTSLNPLTTDLRIGDTVLYTTTVKNTGGSLALSSAIAAVVPAGVEIVPGSITVGGTARTDASGDDQGEYTALTRTVTARFGLGATASAGGSIAPDESLTLTFRAVVQAASGGSTIVWSGATVNYVDYLAPNWGMTATAAAVSTTTALGADVTVTTLSTPVSPAAGTAATWTFTTTNNGPLAAVGVTTTITLPTLTNVTVTRATGAGAGTANCTTSGTTSTCSIGALLSGASRVITITGTLPLTTPAGPVSVVANVTSTANAVVYDHDLTNNSATNTAIATAEKVAPTVPTNVVATSTINGTTPQNTVSWTASTDNVGVTGYEIYRDGVLVGTTASATTSFVDSGRTAGVTHVYTVRAFDAAGNFSGTVHGRVVTTATPFDSTKIYNVTYAQTGQCLTAADNRPPGRARPRRRDVWKRPPGLEIRLRPGWVLQRHCEQRSDSRMGSRKERVTRTAPRLRSARTTLLQSDFRSQWSIVPTVANGVTTYSFMNRQWGATSP